MYTNNPTTEIHQNQNNKDKHLLTEEQFNLLRTIQDEVFKLTEVKPSIRKLLFLMIQSASIIKLFVSQLCIASGILCEQNAVCGSARIRLAVFAR